MPSLRPPPCGKARSLSRRAPSRHLPQKTFPRLLRRRNGHNMRTHPSPREDSSGSPTHILAWVSVGQPSTRRNPSGEKPLQPFRGKPRSGGARRQSVVFDSRTHGSQGKPPPRIALSLERTSFSVCLQNPQKDLRNSISSSSATERAFFFPYSLNPDTATARGKGYPFPFSMPQLFIFLSFCGNRSSVTGCSTPSTLRSSPAGRKRGLITRGPMKRPRNPPGSKAAHDPRKNGQEGELCSA